MAFHLPRQLSSALKPMPTRRWLQRRAPVPQQQQQTPAARQQMLQELYRIAVSVVEEQSRP
jgi:hypothetical protein